MNNLKFRINKSKDSVWVDQNGYQIPVARVSRSEKLKERKSAKIAKMAITLHEKLKELKSYVKQAINEVYDAVMKETGTEPKLNRKGNYTWFNFDKSVKIEVNINEPIEFDDLLIEAAKEKFNEFLNNNISSKNELVKELVMNAFQTKRGKLDVKKVLETISYKDKVNDPLFSEGVDLVNKAIMRKESRSYYRVWIKDENGQYQNVDLNFSSIKIDQ